MFATAPILFHKKSDRIKFYNERKKIKLRSGYFQIEIDTGSDDEDRGR